VSASRAEVGPFCSPPRAASPIFTRSAAEYCALMDIFVVRKASILARIFF